MDTTVYADDSIIMVSDKDPRIIEQKLAEELGSVNKWLIENKLTLHPGKCEAILFASKRKCSKTKDFKVQYNGSTIESKSNVKYLGTTIDRSLSGQDNVSNIISKSNNKLKFLYRHKRVLNTEMRKILSTSLIQGNIDYASVSYYFGLGKNLKHKLQVIQNKMVRYIFNMGPRDHVGNAELKKAGFLNSTDRVTQLGMNITHNIFYNKCPYYLKTVFVKTRDVHSHDTRGSNYNFRVPKINTVTAGTFYYNAIKQWNSLPDDLRSVEDKVQFKKSLKTHLKIVADQRHQSSVISY